jgi:plastocyanin
VSLILPKSLLLAAATTALVGWAGVSSRGAAPVQGSVSGRVIVSASPPPPPTPLSPYARRRYSPPQAAGQPGGAEDAFVYLESLDRQAPTESDEPVVITQRQRTIIPHTIVARVGQVVEFPNEDDVYHNLFSLSSGNRFNLGRYAPGVTETNVFEHPGVVHLFCDIHAEMAGEILVVDTPYVTRVGADGTYSLAVPAGRYRAVAWHPSAGADTATITIPDGPTVAQDFALIGGR